MPIATPPVLINGLTFPGKTITPENDGLIRQQAIQNGPLGGFSVTVENNAFVVSYGWNIVCGRLNYNPQHNDDQLKFNLTYTTHSFAALVLTLDKTTSQASLDVMYYDSYNTFPVNYSSDAQTGDKQPINTNVGARYYKQVLAAAVWDTSTDPNNPRWRMYYTLPTARARLTKYELTINVDDWQGGTTATCNFLYVDKQSDILVTYAPASHDKWVQYGVYATGVTNGHIIFKASSTPTSNLTAYVILI